MPPSSTVNRSEQTQAIFSHGKCRFSLKSRFSKGYPPKKTKMKNWQRLTWKIAFRENQSRIFFHLSPTASAVMHHPEKDRNLQLASLHICWTPVIAPAGSCFLTFPKQQLLQGATTGYKEATALHREPRREAAEAVYAITIQQFSNQNFTAKWVMSEYIQVL